MRDGRITETCAVQEAWSGDEPILLVRNRTHGLHIYVVTLMAMVEDITSSDDLASRIEAILDDSPGDASSSLPYADLDELYHRILLSSVPDDRPELVERFQTIVGTIALLADPLPLDSLATLLGVETTTISCVLSRLHYVITPPTHQLARIRHASFHDYLVQRCSDKRFRLDVAHHHGRIAERCIKLMLVQLERNMWEIEDETLLNCEVTDRAVRQEKYIPAHLKYACTFWGSHLSKASGISSDELVCSFRGFGSKKVLQWLEVMSLLGKVDVATASLDYAKLWYSRNGSTDETAALLEDARRFTREFLDTIQEGAGHVYHSALRFAPPCTLKTTYQSDIPPGVDVILGQASAWDACIRSLHGHTGHISSVSVCCNGKWILSTSEDGTIRLWDAETGVTSSTLLGHTDTVTHASFSPDGQIVASSSLDMTVRVWEPLTGVVLYTLESHNQGILCLFFSTDGSYLVSTSCEQICVWDTKTQRLLSTLDNDQNDFAYANFIPGGHLIVTSTVVGYVTLWDWRAGWPSDRTIFEHESLNFPAPVVCISPDGGTLLLPCDHDGNAALIDIEGRILGTFAGENGGFTAAAFTSDGRGVWTSDSVMSLWDVGTKEMLASFDPQAGRISSFTLFPGNNQIGIVLTDNTIRIWDIELACSLSTPEKHKGMVQCLAVSTPMGLLASSSDDGSVRVWDLLTGQPRLVLTYPSVYEEPAQSVCFSPKGDRIAASMGEVICVWDITGELLFTLEEKGHCRVLEFSPSGDRILSGTLSSTWCIWDAVHGTLLQQIESVRLIGCAAYSPLGNFVATCHYPSRESRGKAYPAQIWDVSTGEETEMGQPRIAEPNGIAWSPNGRLLACGSGRDIVVWKRATGSATQTCHGHASAIVWLEFTPDSFGLVSRSEDGVVMYWSLSDETCLTLPTQAAVDHEGWLNVYYPNGKVKRVCRVPARNRPFMRRAHHFDVRTGSIILGGLDGTVSVIRLSKELL